MQKALGVGALILFAVAINGCSGLGVIKSGGGGTGAAAEAKPFDYAAYSANKTETAKKFTDVSSGGILKESKKVIIPDFKVYFNIQARGSAQTGHALSGLGGNRREARVSQKLNLAVDPAVFQKITDTIYADFVAGVKAMGYEVIEAKELADQFPEYKKYSEESMKVSPQSVDDEYAAYAPTGMRMERPGLEIGKMNALSALSTSLQDVAVRATEKLKAIRMQPVYVVGFAEIRSEGNVNRAELQSVQSIRVASNTQIQLGEGWKFGSVRLEKPIASFENYGKFVSADSLTDKTRGIMSALGSALKLGSSNESGSSVIQAENAKYTAAVTKELKTANEIFFARMAIEKGSR